MEHKIILKDNTPAIIRTLNINDLDRSIEFFQNLPSEDRRYLRRDVTDIEVLKEQIKKIDLENTYRLIALINDKIVADGSLEIERKSWKGHIGEIRLVVAHEYQHKGLGMHMAREVYFLAVSKRVEEIVVEVMRPQMAALKIFKRLGFKKDLKLPKYVKDMFGKKQDLIIMRCDLNSLWQELEHYFEDTDWQRTK